MEDSQKEYFKSLIILYHSANWFVRHIFSCRGRGRNRVPDPLHYANLHEFIKKEKQDDVKFQQALLGALPKENMQLYFHERNADTDYNPNPFGNVAGEEQTLQMMNMDKRGGPADNSGQAFEEKTADIFGKCLP